MNRMNEETDYKLGLFTDVDHSRLIRLSESTYPGREISQAGYLQWEYEHNPDGTALIHVASLGDKFVSQYVVLPHKYSMDGRLLEGSLSLNTLTHPMHRGNSLFPKLAELTFESCIEKNYVFTLGVPNSNSYPVFIEKLGFQVLGRVPFLMKSFRPQSLLWHLFTKKRLKHGADLELNIENLTQKKSDGISVFNPNQDKDLYSAFLKKFTQEKRIATYRSLDFLRWRYLDIPFRKYYLLKSVKEGKMEALAIFRAREIYGLKCGILMDFICSGDPETADKMLEFLNDFSQNNELQLIICAMQNGTKEFQFLKKNGFYKVPERFLPQQLDLILKIHKQDSDYEHLRDFKSWFFTFGDYDIF